MKLEFKKDALLNGINIVSKAIPSRTTMSILECILIDADAGEIKLTGNDMELGIETKVEGEILEHGKIALEQDSPKTRKAVLERISRELSYTERKHPFGTVISYGQLFTALENTEGVKKVLELNLERTGNAERMTEEMCFWMQMRWGSWRGQIWNFARKEEHRL